MAVINCGKLSWPGKLPLITKITPITRITVALRGQKVLPLPFLKLRLQFFVALRGPSWTKGVDVADLQLQLTFFVALRVLRGQKVLPLQFFAALRGP